MISRLLAIAVLVVGLCGCGQKGPLVLPPPESPASSPASSPAP